jgi:hypothetical protein
MLVVSSREEKPKAIRQTYDVVASFAGAFPVGRV